MSQLSQKRVIDSNVTFETTVNQLWSWQWYGFSTQVTLVAKNKQCLQQIKNNLKLNGDGVLWNTVVTLVT